MKETASFCFTSIKSSQAYDTRRRQMTPSLKPLNGIALQAVLFFFHPLTSQWRATFRPTQTPDFKWSAQSASPSVSACLRFFAGQPSHPPVFLYPFTQPLSAPVLGARPGFRQGSVCSRPWQPATLLFLSSCPAILETVCPYPLQSLSNLTGPLNGQQTQPAPDRHTSKLLKPHLPGNR